MLGGDMLKSLVKQNLENVVKEALVPVCGDVLAYDIAKQCVTEEDAERCLESMLEHISEERLSLFLTLFNSEAYQEYLKALEGSLCVIKGKVEDTIKLLVTAEGEA